MNAIVKSPIGRLFGGFIRMGEQIPEWPVYLGLRVWIAKVFWDSGQTKILDWDNTIFLFEDVYMVPLVPAEWAAYAATTFELAMPVFLVVGLATRLAALPLLGMTMVIHFLVFPMWMPGGQWAEFVIWLSILTLLATRGPGSFSIDHLVRGKFGN